MNEQVKIAVEELFAGYPCTQENVDLKEELLCDLSERFEDDLAAGCTQQEAMKRMEESLADIRQLLQERSPAGQAAQQEDSRVRQAYPAAGLKSVNAQLITLGLTMEKVSGDQVLIGYEGPESDFELVHYRLEGDQLLLWEEKGDLLSHISRLINLRLGSKLRLGIPQNLHLDYDVRCVSGSIQSNVPMGTGHLESISGQVRLECAGHVAKSIEAKSKSGGIALHLDARTLQAHSLSGSVKAEGWCDEASLGSVSGSVRFGGHAGRLSTEQTSGGCHLAGTFGTVNARLVSGGFSLRCEAAPESVQARTISGRICIALPQSVSAVALEAKSLSGKVKSAFPQGAGPRIQAQSTSGSILVENT